MNAFNEELSESTPLVAGNASKSSLERARRLLYASHFFAQFSEAAWQFSLVLFLAAFTNYESLILISTYGLTSGLSICLFGACTGRFVDSKDRLYVARSFILTQNMCVLIATALCYQLLSMSSLEGVHWWESANYKSALVMLVGIHVCGSLAAIFDKGLLVAIERDWIVIMSNLADDQQDWLSATNVMLKQIDLSCKIAAPAVAGFIIGAFDSSKSSNGADLTGAALLVGGLNVASLVAEYVCTERIYLLIPALANPASQQISVIRRQESSVNTAEMCSVFRLPNGLETYIGEPIWPAGMSLSLLYLNSLTFGGLMTAFLVWRGMRLETVGVWRGVSAAVGLAGTFVYHFSTKHTTLVNTGMWSVVYQLLCISTSFWSLFIDDYLLSITLLIGGVCLSRIGLWVFDISVTQLMQLTIPAGIRGLVGGTQQSLNAFFQLVAYALGIVFPKPEQFHIYVAAGYIAVGISASLYFVGVYLKRRHLVEQQSAAT